MSMILAAILAFLHFTSERSPVFAGYPSSLATGNVREDYLAGADDYLMPRLTLQAADGFAAAVNAMAMRQSVPFMRGTFPSDILDFTAIPSCRDWGYGTLSLARITDTNFWLSVSTIGDYGFATNIVWDFSAAGNGYRMLRDLRAAWGILGFGSLGDPGGGESSRYYPGNMYTGHFPIERNWQAAPMTYIAPLFYQPGAGEPGEERSGLYDAVAGYTCRYAPGVRWSYSNPGAPSPMDLIHALAPTNFLCVFGRDRVYDMLYWGGNGFPEKCGICGDTGPAFGSYGSGFDIGDGATLAGYRGDHAGLEPSWSNVVMAAVGVDIGNAHSNWLDAVYSPGRFLPGPAKYLNASLAALDTVVFGDGVWPRPKWTGEGFTTPCTNIYMTPPISDQFICAPDSNGVYQVVLDGDIKVEQMAVRVICPAIDVVDYSNWADSASTPNFFAQGISPNKAFLPVQLAFTGLVSFAVNDITRFMAPNETVRVAFLGPGLNHGPGHTQLELWSHFEDDREISGYYGYVGGYGHVSFGPELHPCVITASVPAHVAVDTCFLQPWGVQAEKFFPKASRRATFPPYQLRRAFGERFTADVTTFAHLHGYYTNSVNTTAKVHTWRAYGLEAGPMPGRVERHFLDDFAPDFESSILRLAVINPDVFNAPAAQTRVFNVRKAMAHGDDMLNLEWIHDYMVSVMEVSTNFIVSVDWDNDWHDYKLAESGELLELDSQTGQYRPVGDTILIPYTITAVLWEDEDIPEEEMLSYVSAHGKGDYFSIGAVKIPYPAMKNTWRESQ